LDAVARRFATEAADSGRPLRIVAVPPGGRGAAAYREAQAVHLLTDADQILFLEVAPLDGAEPAAGLNVAGEQRHGYRVLRVVSPDVAGTVAAVLLHLRDRTGRLPRVYFTWDEDHPLARLVRLIVSGTGEVPLLTRAILARAEPDPAHRPTVHVA
jgi:hypothetical protein